MKRYQMKQLFIFSFNLLGLPIIAISMCDLWLVTKVLTLACDYKIQCFVAC